MTTIQLRPISFLTVIGFMTLVTSGCLQTREDLAERQNNGENQDQVVSMQHREAAAERPATKAVAIPETRVQAAETTSNVSDLESTTRELNGRVEILERKFGQADQGTDESRKALEAQLAESNRKTQLLQDEVTKLDAQVQSLNEQVTQMSAAMTAQAAAKEEAKADKKAPFDSAEELFKKKDWKKAIVAYQRYRDQSPKGKQVNEATYKIGVCFQELGMKEESRSFYEELIGKAPASPEAKRARIRLKKL